MPTLDSPNTMKAVLGVGMAKEGHFQFPATVWPRGVEEDTYTFCCLFLRAQLPAAASLAMPEPGAYPGEAEMLQA